MTKKGYTWSAYRLLAQYRSYRYVSRSHRIVTHPITQQNNERNNNRNLSRNKTQLAKMSIDPKFVELTADVLQLFFYNIYIYIYIFETKE